MMLSLSSSVIPGCCQVVAHIDMIHLVRTARHRMAGLIKVDQCETSAHCGKGRMSHLAIGSQRGGTEMQSKRIMVDRVRQHVALPGLPTEIAVCQRGKAQHCPVAFDPRQRFRSSATTSKATSRKSTRC